MATGVTEDGVEDAAGPVDHGRLLVEVGGGSHEPGHGEDALDTVEAAEGLCQDGQRVQRTDLGGHGPDLDTDVVTQRPDTGQLALDARQLTRRPGHIAVNDDGVERVVGRMWPVKGQTK